MVMIQFRPASMQPSRVRRTRAPIWRDDGGDACVVVPDMASTTLAGRQYQLTTVSQVSTA